MSRTLITGSIAYDVLLGFEGSFRDSLEGADLSRLSVSYFSPHYMRRLGGSGSNIAWTLKQLGGDPLLVGAVGSDGSDYLTALKNVEIDTSYVAQVDDQATATAIIGTDQNARQIAFFHPGADSHSPWPDLSPVQDGISYAVSSPRDMTQMLACVEWCHEHGIKCLFDPGQQAHIFSKDDYLRTLKMSAGLICNDYEWSIIKKKIGMDELELLELTPMVIVTLGERGVAVQTKDESFSLDASPTSGVVNPTGAGDALRAGLLYGLDQNWDVKDALRLGAILGSMVIEIDGTQLDDLNKSEIQRRSTQAYNHELPFSF